MLVGATTRVQNSGEDIKMLPKISTSPDITPPGTPPSPFGGLPNYGVATPSNSMSVLVSVKIVPIRRLTTSRSPPVRKWPELYYTTTRGR